MLSKFRTVVSTAVTAITDLKSDAYSTPAKDSSSKYSYNRPHFLQLNTDEVQVSADHLTRPILVPRDPTCLAWNSGYAEVINIGKTKYNEDQASFRRGTLTHTVDNRDCSVEYAYFGLFDGHAGTGAAIMAAAHLHEHIQERLESVQELILEQTEIVNDVVVRKPPPEHIVPRLAKLPTIDQLIIGALETAFVAMDEHIYRDRKAFNVRGGCTALVALFILGRLYIANAGDSRAVLCRKDDVAAMSTDFNPGSERDRIRQLASLCPKFLRDRFTSVEYAQIIHRPEIGCKVLYRDVGMTGWAYKTTTQEDLKTPLIFGEGKRARLMGIIGVTRGFGDHDLCVSDTDIHIKPFMSPKPAVQVFDVVGTANLGADDVLVMATDGLWDVVANDKAARTIQATFAQVNKNATNRYISAAQDLVLQARGIARGSSWCGVSGGPASADDVSVFVIPLCPHVLSGVPTNSGESSAVATKQILPDTESQPLQQTTTEQISASEAAT